MDALNILSDYLILQNVLIIGPLSTPPPLDVVSIPLGLLRDIFWAWYLRTFIFGECLIAIVTTAANKGRVPWPPNCFR